MSGNGAMNDLITRQLVAWNAHAPERIAADFSPDSAYFSPTLAEADALGPDAVVADTRALFRAFPDFTLTERARAVDDDGARASLWWDVTATFTGPLEPPGFAPTGGRISNHGVAWVEGDNGKITRFHLYYDLNELGRQIGAVPPPGSAGEKMVVTFQKLTARGLRKRDWTS